MPKPLKKQKEIKQNKFDRELRDACHINKGMRVWDYSGTVADKKDVEVLKDYLDIKVGDSYMLISFRWKSKKLEEKSRKETRKLFAKYFPSKLLK